MGGCVHILTTLLSVSTAFSVVVYKWKGCVHIDGDSSDILGEGKGHTPYVFHVSLLVTLHQFFHHYSSIDDP